MYPHGVLPGYHGRYQGGTPTPYYPGCYSVGGQEGPGGLEAAIWAIYTFWARTLTPGRLICLAGRRKRRFTTSERPYSALLVYF